MTNDPMTKTKKYILKPGKHQFAPGSPAVHHNDNVNDAEAEWYIEKYPHIKDLFEISSTDESVKSFEQSVQFEHQSVKSKPESVESSIQSINNEDLPTTN